MSDDQARVILATVTPKGDHSVLLMTTEEKVRIEFALDDLAISMLALTMGSAMQNIKLTRGEKPTIFARTETNE
jgi:hypothetical protein